MKPKHPVTPKSLVSKVFATVLLASSFLATLHGTALATDKTSVKFTAGAAVPHAVQYMIFPDDHSIGKIFILAKPWNVVASPLNATFYINAKGKVLAPQGASYAFTANELAAERPEYLSHFPAGTLQSLNSSYISINDDYLKAIGQITSLQRLDLNETDLEDRQLAYLKDLKNMRCFSINKTLIKGPGLAHISAMKELMFINVSGNSLQPGSTRYLSKFTHINDIGLAHCMLRDDDLLEIAKIKSLTSIRCPFNYGVTDLGIKYLDALPNLATIDIDETQVTVPGLMALKKHKLCVIALPTKFNNKKDTTLLHSAFPKTILGFSGRTKIEPVEFFDPKNMLGR